MTISVFDIFKVGIGPSSSHTVGPMRAALRFARALEAGGLLDRTLGINVQLYGSLALTGHGHCTDRAVILGLLGESPEAIDPNVIDSLLGQVRDSGSLRLLGVRDIEFDEPMCLLFHKDQYLTEHPNGMRFSAFGRDDRLLREQTYFSIGGGFVVAAGENLDAATTAVATPPYPFASAAELLALGRQHGLRWDELMLANECAGRARRDVEQGLDHIWQVMQSCIARGFAADGTLPGGLAVRRRAARIYRDLQEEAGANVDIMDWVNAVALAVNEENAAGGRVVTAPTNGAAGIVPAVLYYYENFVSGADAAGIRRFLLTAGAIGVLYKTNASISGAEMGCQGEVGVACSMAAGGLMAAMGGDNNRIENAAEIGMEHNLGLTCDPIGGLVQIPCIERNAMGAVKAINAARIARRGDGTHKVSLDQVIETMRQTGNDMSEIYKETSKGGLAVNVIEC